MRCECLFLGLRAAVSTIVETDWGSWWESNGMGTPIFFCLDTPKSGGDTLYLSTTAAYDNFSEDFRKRLYGLYATHSGFDQARAVDHQER